MCCFCCLNTSEFGFRSWKLITVFICSLYLSSLSRSECKLLYRKFTHLPHLMANGAGSMPHLAAEITGTNGHNGPKGPKWAQWPQKWAQWAHWDLHRQPSQNGHGHMAMIGLLCNCNTSVMRSEMGTPFQFNYLGPGILQGDFCRGGGGGLGSQTPLPQTSREL